MTHSALMFLRPHQRTKDGKDHIYWSLVETVRTVDGPRQRTLCYLGELNGSAQARWLKSVEVFNAQGEVEQLKLFPSHIEVPDDDPQVARVLVNRVRLERTRQFGGCFLGWELWKRLGLDGFFEQAMDEEAVEVPWSRVAAGAGHQPTVRSGQRVDDRGTLVSLDCVGRSVGNRRRQDQRHASVSLSGPDSAAQDQTGTASEAALRGVIRSRVRCAVV